MNSFDWIKKWIETISPGLWDLFYWILKLLIVDSMRDLYNSFHKHRERSENNRQRSSTIITAIIILCFIIYGLIWIYNDLELYWNKNHYEKVLYASYETEIRSFFDKYNEMYAARDCSFMRKVAADESMYDMYWNEEYPESYSCSNFYSVQEKKWYPIKIYPIEKNWSKYRVKWEALILKKNQWEPYYIDVINFELRKKLDWDLWHLGHIKAENRRIPAKMTIE